MLVEEDAVTSYLLVNGTFADMMCAILGPYRYRSAGCWVSLKDLMFFVDELPNLVDLRPDGRLRDESSFLDA